MAIYYFLTSLSPIFFFIAVLFLHLHYKRQPHKKVKRTQTIRQQIADELFECM